MKYLLPATAVRHWLIRAEIDSRPTEPDSEQPSASPLLYDETAAHGWAEPSKPGLVNRLALLGVRHTQLLSVQAKDPAGHWDKVLHSLQVLLTQMGALADVHEPHVYVPPQPFETEPQFLPEQAVVCDVGVQPQTFAAPPPPQVWGDVHVPQTCMPPQPSGTEPHFPVHAVALTVGTHAQVLGEPWHD